MKIITKRNYNRIDNPLKDDVNICASGKNDCKSCLMEDFCHMMFKKANKNRELFGRVLYSFKIADRQTEILHEFNFGEATNDMRL